MTGTVAAFADPLGPRGKAKVTVATLLGGLGVAWLLYVA